MYEVTGLPPSCSGALHEIATSCGETLSNLILELPKLATSVQKRKSFAKFLSQFIDDVRTSWNIKSLYNCCFVTNVWYINIGEKRRFRIITCLWCSKTLGANGENWNMSLVLLIFITTKHFTWVAAGTHHTATGKHPAQQCTDPKRWF